ncbi:HAD family hydrolase [Streptomyces sp. SHP 1-2]|uniref:HAD family hydrolase n=1 Tax=Streptomyces sp. SHP 1-2 TaxID=2769489 RepID=UPI0022379079|nr:HAD family phosphatase [Streptomyces sp. SHP 1-2]
MSATAHPLLDWSPEAVVFDCDGTLMDSERHWQDARNRAFREFGLRPPRGFADRAKGVHYLDCGRMMAQETNKPDLAPDLAEALLRHFLALVAEEPLTMPGAVEFVRALSGRLPLAVASNCPLVVVEESLGRAGLRGHFEHVVVPSEVPGEAAGSPDEAGGPGAAEGADGRPEGADAADGAPGGGAGGSPGEEDGAGPVRPKPWPDVYATAARLCGVRPEAALAVEDSLTGVESARRAGLRVLGVGPLADENDAGRADLWVTALNAEQLLTWVRDRVPPPAP